MVAAGFLSSFPFGQMSQHNTWLAEQNNLGLEKFWNQVTWVQTQFCQLIA